MKKVAFMTLGCKVNMYETEAMSELFAKKGYEITDFDQYADVYVINTCTVTNFGDKKSRQMIRRASAKNPNAVIAAAGCYAQTSPQEVGNIQGINIVIGTKDRNSIVDIVENYSREKGVLNTVTDIMKERSFEPLSVTGLKGRTRAYLKIQDGCNRFCTYCAIPYARGPVRSRPLEDVKTEVAKLAENGFKEVVLTGIHVASYGMDIGTSLIEAVKVVHNTEGIERIRFSSLEPNCITDEFINEIKSMPKICHHFHLSLQSGCKRTLERMNRRYTPDEYYNAAEKIRAVYPSAAITTDIIVGFPGETEEDFKESCDFAKKVKLAKIHVFPYSPKKGTKAAAMPDMISNDIKKARADIMLNISKELNKNFMEGMKGKIEPVLFERNIEGNIYEGHTSNYIKVRAESGKKIKNMIIPVEIAEIIEEETMKGILK